MVGFIPKNNYIRNGTLGLAVYLPDPSGSVITTPTINSVTTHTYTINEILVASKKRFNVTYSTPGTQRSFKVVFESLDQYGNVTYTAASAESLVTPNAADNVALVHVTVPAKCTKVLVFIDGSLAQEVQSPPACRRGTGVATTQVITVLYEPLGNVVTLDDLDSIRSGYSPLEIRRFALPNTTGELNHEIQFTKIEVPINDLSTEYITTRSSQRITATFVGATSYLQALLTQGAALFECGCGVNMTQLGFQSGACSENRYYELTFPGDACGEQLDAILLAKAVHGEDTQSLGYSSEVITNIPMTLTEASSVINKGQHSLTLLKI